MLSSGVPTLELAAWAFGLGFGAAVGWGVGTALIELVLGALSRALERWTR